jgi:hypothetical protein
MKLKKMIINDEEERKLKNNNIIIVCHNKKDNKKEYIILDDTLKYHDKLIKSSINQTFKKIKLNLINDISSKDYIIEKNYFKINNDSLMKFEDLFYFEKTKR